MDAHRRNGGVAALRVFPFGNRPGVVRHDLFPRSVTERVAIDGHGEPSSRATMTREVDLLMPKAIDRCEDLIPGKRRDNGNPQIAGRRLIIDAFHFARTEATSRFRK